MIKFSLLMLIIRDYGTHTRRISQKIICFGKLGFMDEDPKEIEAARTAKNDALRAEIGTFSIEKS